MREGEQPSNALTLTTKQCSHSNISCEAGFISQTWRNYSLRIAKTHFAKYTTVMSPTLTRATSPLFLPSARELPAAAGAAESLTATETLGLFTALEFVLVKTTRA